MLPFCSCSEQGLIFEHASLVPDNAVSLPWTHLFLLYIIGFLSIVFSILPPEYCSVSFYAAYLRYLYPVPSLLYV